MARAQVTVEAVARLARVSPSTVSRAFSRPDLVQESTRRRIVRAAESVGYEPNRLAAALSRGRTNNLAIIVPDLENPFFPTLVKGSEAHARARGYATFLADTAEDPIAESEIIRSLAKQVDGMVVCSSRLPDDELARVSRLAPLVLINRVSPGVSAVLIDYVQGMRQAVAHLLALGHRRIAYLGGPAASWANQQRLDGFGAAVSEASDVCEGIVLGPFGLRYEGGIHAADDALARGATAIIAYDDLMALGVMSRLEARGATVPDDVSVVGFDDTPLAPIWRPALTTVATSTSAAGKAAVQLLVRSLDDPDGHEAEALTVAANLIVRGTTAPLSTTDPWRGLAARESTAASASGQTLSPSAE